MEARAACHDAPQPGGTCSAPPGTARLREPARALLHEAKRGCLLISMKGSRQRREVDGGFRCLHMQSMAVIVMATWLRPC